MRTTHRSSSLITAIGAVLALAIGAPFASALPPAPLIVTNAAIAPVEGQIFSGTLATVVDPNGVHTAGEYSGMIEWGDGTTTSATIIVTSGSISIVGSHTYQLAGTANLKVSVEYTAHTAAGSNETTIAIADAPLSLPFTAPTTLSGSGSVGAHTAMSAFQAAIGGVDNGLAGGMQSGGLRHIDWDAIKLDGSEPHAQSISAGHTIAVAVDSQQQRGVQLDSPIAVSSDGFTSVNAAAGGLFPPFSAANLAAPFSTNAFTLSLIAPSPLGATPAPAATRALGVTFVNVRLPNTTSIEYRSGDATIAKLFAPSGPAGQPSFVGALFEAPVITSVRITLGNAQIFSFDGAYTNPNLLGEGGEHNMVAADDIVLAEPAHEGATLDATVGTPLSAQLASFQDTDPNAGIQHYSATIDWGDGTRSQGSIAAAAAGGSGGLTVSGTHTYSQAGAMPVLITVHDLGGAQIALHAAILVAYPFIAPPPPPLPPPAAVAAPRCTLSAVSAFSHAAAHGSTAAFARAKVKPRHPRPSPGERLNATATCDQDAAIKLTVTATLSGARTGTGKHAHKAPTTTLALGRISTAAVAGRARTLGITPPSTTLAKLRAAGAQHRRIAVKFTLAAGNAHGSSSVSVPVVGIKLK